MRLAIVWPGAIVVRGLSGDASPLPKPRRHDTAPELARSGVQSGVILSQYPVLVNDQLSRGVNTLDRTKNLTTK